MRPRIPVLLYLAQSVHRLAMRVPLLRRLANRRRTISDQTAPRPADRSSDLAFRRLQALLPPAERIARYRHHGAA